MLGSSLLGEGKRLTICLIFVFIIIIMSQDPLTPGVSQKTYTKSQPFNLINLLVHNIPYVEHKVKRRTKTIPSFPLCPLFHMLVYQFSRNHYAGET